MTPELKPTVSVAREFGKRPYVRVRFPGRLIIVEVDFESGPKKARELAEAILRAADEVEGKDV